MRMLKVTDSKDIIEIGYDVAGKQRLGKDVGTLDVVFKAMPDMVYRYEGVSPHVFADLVSAPSLGKKFAEDFRKTKHPFSKSQRVISLKK